MPSTRCRALARAFEIAVFAPIGAAVFVRDDLPDIVREWRSRAQDQVTLARFIGQRAIAVGREQLGAAAARATPTTHRQATAPVIADIVGGSVDQLDDDEPTGASEPAAIIVIEAATDDAAGEHPAAPAEDPASAVAVPFDGYDSLAAAHIVRRLDRLDRADLAAVRDYEQANRARRTVVAKVDQLLGA